tara:strand:- start:9426 stop:9965 length:540 start_codon:yes stop_codon:yes gene_type:complete
MMLGLEILGSISILLCVYLTAKQNVLCWPIGILGCIAYLIIFYSSELYGESFLQIVFIIQSLYGWYYWKKKDDLLNVTKIGILPILNHLVILIILFIGVIMGVEFMGILDTVITLLSLLATYYLTKKYLESWYLWIVVDILAIILFFDRGLYVSSALYLGLLILATNGLFKWKKSLKTV